MNFEIIMELRHFPPFLSSPQPLPSMYPLPFSGMLRGGKQSSPGKTTLIFFFYSIPKGYIALYLQKKGIWAQMASPSARMELCLLSTNEVDWTHFALIGHRLTLRPCKWCTGVNNSHRTLSYLLGFMFHCTSDFHFKTQVQTENHYNFKTTAI